MFVVCEICEVWVVVVFSFLEENSKTPTYFLPRKFYPLVHLLGLYKISIKCTGISKA